MPSKHLQDRPKLQSAFAVGGTLAEGMRVESKCRPERESALCTGSSTNRILTRAKKRQKDVNESIEHDQEHECKAKNGNMREGRMTTRRSIKSGATREVQRKDVSLPWRLAMTCVGKGQLADGAPRQSNQTAAIPMGL